MKLFLTLLLAATLVGCDRSTAQSSGNLSEEQLEAFFRGNTVAGNHAAAIKLQFTVPQPGVAYLGTIHGYPNNLSVCEELIAPYNEDSSLTTIPGGSYFCEVLRSWRFQLPSDPAKRLTSRFSGPLRGSAELEC